MTFTEALKAAYEETYLGQKPAASQLAESFGPAEFCPGDATRYVMHLVRVENARHVGYSDGCYILTVLNMPGHVWTLGSFVGPYDLDVHGVSINPWTKRACLLWLESLKIEGFTVEIPEEVRRGR